MWMLRALSLSLVVQILHDLDELDERVDNAVHGLSREVPRIARHVNNLFSYFFYGGLLPQPSIYIILE